MAEYVSVPTSETTTIPMREKISRVATAAMTVTPFWLRTVCIVILQPRQLPQEGLLGHQDRLAGLREGQGHHDPPDVVGGEGASQLEIVHVEISERKIRDLLDQGIGVPLHRAPRQSEANRVIQDIHEGDG